MYRLPLLFALLPLVTGCYTLKAENMVVDADAVDTKHPATVAITVKGGSPGVKWYSGTMEPEDFGWAVRQLVEKVGLFQEIVPSEQADYLLDVDLTFAGSHPGFNMTGWVNADWSLVHRASKESNWAEEVKGEGKASIGEAFNATTRQYKALERAGKANITEALGKIGKIQLRGRE